MNFDFVPATLVGRRNRRNRHTAPVVSVEVQRLETRRLLSGYESHEDSMGLYGTLNGEYVITSVNLVIAPNVISDEQLHLRLAIVDGAHPAEIAALIASDRINRGLARPHAELENNLAADLGIRPSDILRYDVYVGPTVKTGPSGADPRWQAMPILGACIQTPPQIIHDTVTVTVPGPKEIIHDTVVVHDTVTVNVNVYLVQWTWKKDPLWLKMHKGDQNAVWQQGVVKGGKTFWVPLGVTPYGTPATIILKNGIYAGTTAVHGRSIATKAVQPKTAHPAALHAAHPAKVVHGVAHPKAHVVRRPVHA
ncbi:MAG: hypothetical protein U0136_02945 [Bdellovibrionota bacterium]